MKQLESLAKSDPSDSTLNQVLDFYREISDKCLNELKLQAHNNIEYYWCEKLVKWYDDESDKIMKIIEWLWHVINDTLKRT